MPPVHRLRRAVVGQGVTLVSHHVLAVGVQDMGHLQDGGASIGEQRRAARIAHLAYLRTGGKETRACREIVDVEVALAVLAHIEVEALRTDQHTVGRRGSGVMHPVHHHVAQRRLSLGGQRASDIHVTTDAPIPLHVHVALTVQALLKRDAATGSVGGLLGEVHLISYTCVKGG